MMRRLIVLGLFISLSLGLVFLPAHAQAPKDKLFGRDNLVAWCIVPFDAKKRGPEERAAMLKRLGFARFAYDWRAEHIASFDAEMEALKRHGIRLEAFWFPAQLNKDARTILDLLKRHQVKAQLWVTLGDPDPAAKEQAAKIEAAARILRPIIEEASKIGCTVGLYNHGGWFGEPENQIALIEHLKRPEVGIVYNLHHGHDHLDRFPALLKKMKPHLWALNLNGMVKDGDKVGKKILPLGQGDLDPKLLKIIHDSGYTGPIGILGHTMDDAEDRLRDNLDGLDWLLRLLYGEDPGPRPQPRTFKGPGPKKVGKNLEPDKGATGSLSARANSQGSHGSALADKPPVAPTSAAPKLLAYSPELVSQLVTAAKMHGDAKRGAAVFRSPLFACSNCHKVGQHGGIIGPELGKAGTCLTPEQIVESVLWPKRQVKEGYAALSVVTGDGKQHQGYKEREDAKELVLRDPATGNLVRVAKDNIDDQRETGTLMPEGLAEAMTAEQRRDVVRFLMDLGKTEGLAELAAPHSLVAATFPLERAPLQPQFRPNWNHPVNGNRLYDFYSREADYFMKQPSVPHLLPHFPGLEGPKYGHWGAQNEKTWADGRWNHTDLGSLLSGVFRGGGVTVPRGICVHLGDKGELAACFNPETLCYEALWEGGFLKFSSVRHGFMDGLIMNGTALPRPDGRKPEKPFVYHGLYRHGKRVLFSYSIDGVRYLDAPWVENGKFTRTVARAEMHPLAKLTKGGPMQWPQILETRGTLGSGAPYVVDNITVPVNNPWNAPLYFGDHDFLPDGAALICTMQGEVWHVSGLDDKLGKVRWRRFATGLHQALGLVVADGSAYVLGRDQITRLHDLNGDGEADFYECFANGYQTSTGGHDFICGLQRDAKGNFYTAHSKQGLIRIAADGTKVDVLATGFRNPDGLGLYPDGALTVPCSEGEWTPASMLCLVRPGLAPSKSLLGDHTPPFFGYGGPKNNQPPDLPFVYFPRGLDNSSGGQAYIDSDRWGPLQGRMVHFSFGAGSHMLLLRDEVDGQPQGAVVPLQGEFLSGAHRGRFSPKDGQLYVSGMAGWGTYTIADGCFQRVRYTGQPVQLPGAFRVHENGVRVTFTSPVDPDIARQVKNHFAQAWNYRYSSAYGSPEFSPRHPGTPGHDPVTIAAAHVLPDGRSIFLEMPELQPVNQLHLRMRVDAGLAQDLFVTVHKLGEPFTNLPNYKPNPRTIAAHPILVDLQTAARAVANPWKTTIPKAQAVGIQADKNLTFVQRTLKVKAGQPIRLNFSNPDNVPHNWVLLKPGTLQTIGELTNRMIAEPDAAARHYVPKSSDVLVYTDIVPPQGSFTIYFRAPAERGRYPYLCTFPGHWMVMNGQMIVE